jgi:hypothetical protein
MKGSKHFFFVNKKEAKKTLSPQDRAGGNATGSIAKIMTSDDQVPKPRHVRHASESWHPRLAARATNLPAPQGPHTAEAPCTT